MEKRFVLNELFWFCALILYPQTTRDVPSWTWSHELWPSQSTLWPRRAKPRRFSETRVLATKRWSPLRLPPRRSRRHVHVVLRSSCRVSVPFADWEGSGTGEDWRAGRQAGRFIQCVWKELSYNWLLNSLLLRCGIGEETNNQRRRKKHRWSKRAHT